MIAAEIVATKDAARIHQVRIVCIQVYLLITSDKGEVKCFCPYLFVCLPVCLLVRLLKNACMDLDEMLRVG